MATRRNTEETDVPKPKFERDTIRKIWGMFSFVRPYRMSLILGMVLLFLSSLTFMVFPKMSGIMIDVAQGKSDYDLTLGRIGWILGGILVFRGFVSFARVMLFARVSERGIADVRHALYRKLLSLPITFYESNRTGELVSRLTSDVEKLYNTFSITLAEFVRQIIILLVGIGFLALTTPKLALIMLATFPVIVIGAIFFGRQIRKLSKERQQVIADTNIILSETMSAIAAVKAFTNEWFELARYGKVNQAVVDISMKFARGRAIFSVFIIVMLFGALFFIIWEGASMVQSGSITAGDLVSFVTYTAIIGGAIAGLGNFYTELLGAVGATDRIREILDMPGEVPVGDTAVTSNNRLNGDIRFEDVRFEYPSRADVPVLKGINLHIKPGQKVALVGASGAGKSTIVQLLLQFHKATSGRIVVDDKPISDYELSEFRSHFAIVPQEVLLFGGTIRENILYGKPDATDAEVLAAAQQANAWEFIVNFPEQLETLVGERGIKLSGGQRQRIAIARAILRDPAILLLDEATSSLDAESERVVQVALDRLMEGRTSIIIAHRLATIREVDCIYVLNNGLIAEQGTHDELSAIPDGIYNNLARLQFDAVHA